MLKTEHMSNQRKLLRLLQFISYLQQKPNKSIQQLARLLETTERTAYRYVELIRSCGFDLQQDHLKRFYLVQEETTELRFSTEEATYLQQLILTSGKRNKLKDAVLRKIYMASDIQILAGNLVYAKNGLIVERLAQAIAEKKQVTLKKYQSIHSESISDRMVEPFGFTDNFHTVMAFEPSSAKNKTYHLERIASVEVSSRNFQHEKEHEQQIPDAFGFSYSGKKYPISMDLSLKEYLLLKDAYPLTSAFVKYNAKSQRYELRMEVNSLVPVERMGIGENSKGQKT